MTPTHLLTRLLIASTGRNANRQTLWKVVSTLAGVGAGVATRMLIQKTWAARTGKEPPANPADPAVSWPQALAWSAGLGVGVGVARTVAQRGAVRAWTEAMGEAPPGLVDAGAQEPS